MAKKTLKKRVVLLDTHAILHRAYHALPDFTAPNGEPTGALYGLTAFIIKILDELNPDYLIAAYDLPEPTLRHEAFSEYKGTRKKTDDALIAQLENSREILDVFSIPHLEVPGFEADDILGTLVEKLKNKDDIEILIASGDMDTLQLVQGNVVQVYTLKKGINDTIIYNEDSVRERYGFGPKLVADFKGLRGDPSDNIPGIQGIGEKTATTLLTLFGDLDTIYETLKKHPEKFKEAGVTPRIVKLLEEGEDDARFSKELATIRCDAPIKTPLLGRRWIESVELDKVLTLFKKLGFRTLGDRLRTKLGGQQEEQNDKEVKEEIIDPKELEETAIALWLVRSDITNPTIDDILEYTGASSFGVARAEILQKLHDEELMRVYKDIELPLIPLIRAMEEKGILLDVAYLLKLSKRYHADLEEMAQRIFTTAGVAFNINSPKQLGEVLFDKLGIGAGKGKKTATGQRSTREEELRKYADKEPIISDILEYRELQKLLSTYIDNLPTMVDVKNRLHAHFSQTGTTTGRMSSQSPNMQNIPIKSSRGAAIRKAVIAPDGYSLIAADYSQIELRVVAFISGDEKLIQSFKEGQDVHTAVASEVFGVPPEFVDKEMRRRAKVINFGILYGMGANALAVATNVSRKEAQTYLTEYFKRFSGIARYVESNKIEVRTRGYTKTWFGRRRYFEGITSPLPYVQAQAERMALNAPIQGTSADIIKVAMVRMERALQKHDLKQEVALIAQVHDELIFEVKDEKVAQTAELIRENMEMVLSLEDTCGVPLKVDVEVGKNWGEMERVESKE